MGPKLKQNTVHEVLNVVYHLLECKCPKRRTLTFLDRGNLDFVFKKYSCNGGLYEGFRLVNMIVEWVIRLLARQCLRIFQMF